MPTQTQPPPKQPRVQKKTQRQFFFMAAIVETEEVIIASDPTHTPPPGKPVEGAFADELPSRPGIQKATAVPLATVIQFPFKRVASSR